MLINRFPLHVEWGDCDAAGIVFYPRYFAWFDAATFHLFARTGLSMRALWEKYGSVGTPLVDARSRFVIPSRWGDDLVCESGVSEWGESSFSVQHRILKDGKLAVEGLEKRVWVTPHPTEKGRIENAPIPREIVASVSEASGATVIASSGVHWPAVRSFRARQGPIERAAPAPSSKRSMRRRCPSSCYSRARYCR